MITKASLTTLTTTFSTSSSSSKTTQRSGFAIRRPVTVMPSSMRRALMVSENDRVEKGTTTAAMEDETKRTEGTTILTRRRATGAFAALATSTLLRQCRFNRFSANDDDDDFVAEAMPAFQFEEDGLKTASSGLRYADVVVGTGASPTKGQTIQAHYTGRLTNGRVFDSSYDRGSPLKFKVGVRQVIQGWDDGILGAEGIEGMKVGGKRVLIIPPELGYGARGAGGVIPGNATLQFDVELVAVL